MTQAYTTDGKRNSVRHGLAGEDRRSPVVRMSVFLQEFLHVPDILESKQKLTHALRLGQGMEHALGEQIEVLKLYRFHGALHHIICNVQIHVSAEVGKVFTETGHNQQCKSANLK